MVPAWLRKSVRNVRISFQFLVTPMTENVPEWKIHQAGILEQCADLFDQKRLRIQVDKVFPLQQAADAQNYLENNFVTGKVVLEI